jgi:glycosyltransferase involved in cell wall biosynthesis
LATVARDRVSEPPREAATEVVTEPLVADPVDRRLAALRRVAIVPALNEAETVASVVSEIRSFDPDFEVVVVDDGSTDETTERALEAGAKVLRLPLNLGIGGAMQAGYVFALEEGFELAVQVDGDGQHDPRELGRLVEPILDDRADMVIGSRFASPGTYRASIGRSLGIRLFAAIVSLRVRQRMTDTTSGFRGVNRRGINVFAGDYPHDYPEVETVVTASRGGLRICEVPVQMRLRSAGRSSISNVGSAYYMVKVLLALFIGLLPQGKATKR